MKKAKKIEAIDSKHILKNAIIETLETIKRVYIPNELKREYDITIDRVKGVLVFSNKKSKHNKIRICTRKIECLARHESNRIPVCIDWRNELTECKNAKLVEIK